MENINRATKLIGLLISSTLLIINLACYLATFVAKDFNSSLAGGILVIIMIPTFVFMFIKAMKGTKIKAPKGSRTGYWGAMMHAPNLTVLTKISAGLWVLLFITIGVEKFMPNGGRILLSGLLIPYFENFIIALSSYYEFKKNDMDELYLD